MIRVTDTISIDESELEESFVRSSGPGGQNVNKVSSAVQLRFDARRSPSLPNDVATRLMRLAGSRLTKEGVIVIVAQAHRDQTRNRAEARERLVELIREAAVKPKPRRATKVPKSAKRQRLETKKHRSDIKRHRSGRPSFEERGQGALAPRPRHAGPLESARIARRSPPCPSANCPNPSSTASPPARWWSGRPAW
jgi:ribosome-associated protein